MIENLSGRKLSVLCLVLLLLLLGCFLIGGLRAPAPTNSQHILGTICNASGASDKRQWFQVWSVPSQRTGCAVIESVQLLFERGASSDQVVFAFQMPLRKDRRLLDFSRWQQNLIGVLHVDMNYDREQPIPPDSMLNLHARIGYKNFGDPTEDWTLLAESVEERPLHCVLESEQQEPGDGEEQEEEEEEKLHYACDLVPLFELGSLHHDFYLLNLRLPDSSDDIAGSGHRSNLLGKLEDLHLVVIHANGGFTRVWVTLKSVFFPLLVLLLVWFWRRVRQLGRPAALLERMLLWLGVSLSLLNLPLELLSLSLDAPALLLLGDVRQGLFYSALLSFWLVFAGEHLIVSHEPSTSGRLSVYWRHLLAVAVGCLALFMFDVTERGHQLINPFYSVWGSVVGSRLALAFIVTAGVAAGLYFCFLTWMIWRVLSNMSMKRHALPAMSAVRRLHYEGIMYRFRFLMAATLVCAAMTVAGFVLGQVAEGEWKWDEHIQLQYTSAVMCGVYGMWNVYTAAVICLYAPSHKHWTVQSSGLTAAASVSAIDSPAEEIEFSRLAPPAMGQMAEEASDLSSLARFMQKPAVE